MSVNETIPAQLARAAAKAYEAGFIAGYNHRRAQYGIPISTIDREDLQRRLAAADAADAAGPPPGAYQALAEIAKEFAAETGAITEQHDD